MPKKAAATSGSKPAAATAPKKRGRPPGSSNKKKPLEAAQGASKPSDGSEAGANDRIAQDSSKQAAFEALRSAVNSRFGQGSMMNLTDPADHIVDCIPTGNAAVDRILGGGLPKGRIVEVYGMESGGKTTLVLQSVAAIQKATGGNAVFIDVEHSLNPKYATELGVDLSRMTISQPDSGEDALEIADMAIKSGVVDVVVLDSVAALVTKAELEGSMEDQQVGVQARLMGKAMRKITSAVKKSKCIALFVNQLRDKVGTMGYGEQTTTPGGRSLKFHASVRLDVRKYQQIKRGETIIGHTATVKCVKNKVAPPMKRCNIDLYYTNANPPGFCPATALLDEAVDAKVVTKSNATFRFDGEVIGVGREKVRRELLSDKKLFKAIQKELAKA